MGGSRQIGYEILRAWLERHAPPKVVFLETSETDLVQWPHPLLSDIVRPVEALRLIAEQPYSYRDPKHYGRENPYPGKGEPPFDPGGLAYAFEAVQLNIDEGLKSLGRGPEDIARYVSNRFWNGMDERGWDNPYRRSEDRADVPEILPAVTLQQVDEAGWYQISRDSSDWITGPDRVKKKLQKRAEIWRQERGVDPDGVIPPGDHWDDDTWYRASRFYLRKIADLCAAYDIRLVVHELPSFGDPRLTKEQMDFSRQHAELFRPDMEILHRADFFQDPGHLSTNGARWYSAQLAKYLAENPEQGH